MEEPHKTHKEPAWGWVGAFIQSVQAAKRGHAGDNKVTAVTRRRADHIKSPSLVARRGRRTA